MKRDKNIEEFTKYILKEANLEAPSESFVNNIMDTIAVENNKSKVTVYKPLISKVSWFLIAISLIILFVFLYKTNTESTYLLSLIDVSFLDKFSDINIFKNLKLPTIFTFSCVVFSVLVIFQLHYIKKYFNTRNVI